MWLVLFGWKADLWFIPGSGGGVGYLIGGWLGSLVNIAILYELWLGFVSHYPHAQGETGHKPKVWLFLLCVVLLIAIALFSFM